MNLLDDFVYYRNRSVKIIQPIFSFFQNQIILRTCYKDIGTPNIVWSELTRISRILKSMFQKKSSLQRDKSKLLSSVASKMTKNKSLALLNKNVCNRISHEIVRNITKHDFLWNVYHWQNWKQEKLCHFPNNLFIWFIKTISILYYIRKRQHNNIKFAPSTCFPENWFFSVSHFPPHLSSPCSTPSLYFDGI